MRKGTRIAAAGGLVGSGRTGKRQRAVSPGNRDLPVISLQSRKCRLGEIVSRLGGELVGNPEIEIRRIATLQNAGPGDLSFLSHARYRRHLDGTRAAAVIVSRADRDATSLPRILCEDPYVYYARAAQLLNPGIRPAPGVHPNAVIETGALVPASASIGPGCHIGRGVRLGERVAVQSGCTIGDEVHIGDDSDLYPSVTVYSRCVIGKRAIIHAGVVIGSDGFGMALDKGRWTKIPQTGRVLIGDDVEIGANTTVDRGALDDTVIEEGVKLDNQIQVGHNVRIGAHTAIAGCVGIAGSTRIGRNCMIGGGARIVGHLEIADGVTVSAAAVVTKSIARAGIYAGVYPIANHREWAKTAAHLRSLDRLVKRVRELEKRISKPGKRKR
jgi:UDP-3-O-[3-hydroxymyristoyl] glucosamine N-acyltransferase